MGFLLAVLARLKTLFWHEELPPRAQVLDQALSTSPDEQRYLDRPNPKYQVSRADYALHLDRHERGLHVNRFYDDCGLCVAGVRPKTSDPVAEWDDQRHRAGLDVGRDDATIVIEPSVPIGSTYAPTVNLPTTRSSLCLERCKIYTGFSGYCHLACLQLEKEQTLAADPAKALLDSVSPEAEAKTVRYPTPAEDMTVTEWVDWRIGRGAIAPSGMNRSEAGTGAMSGISLHVDRGFSMSYLQDIVDRAKRKDMTLTLDQLAAARSRGLI